MQYGYTAFNKITDLCEFWLLNILTFNIQEMNNVYFKNRDCNHGIPGSRDSDPGNFPIPKYRDWAALNPGISGLTKFIHLTVF